MLPPIYYFIKEVNETMNINAVTNSYLYDTLNNASLLGASQALINDARSNKRLFEIVPMSNEDVLRVGYRNPHIRVQTDRIPYLEIWVNDDYINPESVTWVKSSSTHSYGVLPNYYDIRDSANVCKVYYNPHIVYRYTKHFTDNTTKVFTKQFNLNDPKYSGIASLENSCFFITDNSVCGPVVDKLVDNNVSVSINYVGDIDFFICSNLKYVKDFYPGVGQFIDNVYSNKCYYNYIVNNDDQYPINAKFYPCIAIDKQASVRVYDDNYGTINNPSSRLVLSQKYIGVADPYAIDTDEEIPSADIIHPDDTDEVKFVKLSHISKDCFNVFNDNTLNWLIQNKSSDFVICDNKDKPFKVSFTETFVDTSCYVRSVFPAEEGRDLLFCDDKLFSDYTIEDGKYCILMGSVPAGVSNRFTCIKFNIEPEGATIANITEYFDKSNLLLLHKKLNRFYQNIVAIRDSLDDVDDTTEVYVTAQAPDVIDDHLWFELLADSDPDDVIAKLTGIGDIPDSVIYLARNTGDEVLLTDVYLNTSRDYLNITDRTLHTIKYGETGPDITTVEDNAIWYEFIDSIAGKICYSKNNTMVLRVDDHLYGVHYDNNITLTGEVIDVKDALGGECASLKLYGLTSQRIDSCNITGASQCVTSKQLSSGIITDGDGSAPRKIEVYGATEFLPQMVSVKSGVTYTADDCENTYFVGIETYGRSEQVITAQSKNLYNPATALTNSAIFIGNYNGWKYATGSPGGYTYIQYIPAKQGDTFTASLKHMMSGNSGSMYLIAYFTANKATGSEAPVIIGTSTRIIPTKTSGEEYNYASLTAPAGTAYLFVALRVSTTETYYFKEIQIERGAVATSYTAYSDSSPTIEHPSNVSCVGANSTTRLTTRNMVSTYDLVQLGFTYANGVYYCANGSTVNGKVLWANSGKYAGPMRLVYSLKRVTTSNINGAFLVAKFADGTSQSCIISSNNEYLTGDWTFTKQLDSIVWSYGSTEVPVYVDKLYLSTNIDSINYNYTPVTINIPSNLHGLPVSKSSKYCNNTDNSNRSWCSDVILRYYTSAVFVKYIGSHESDGSEIVEVYNDTPINGLYGYYVNISDAGASDDPVDGSAIRCDKLKPLTNRLLPTEPSVCTVPDIDGKILIYIPTNTSNVSEACDWLMSNCPIFYYILKTPVLTNISAALYTVVDYFVIYPGVVNGICPYTKVRYRSTKSVAGSGDITTVSIRYPRRINTQYGDVFVSFTESANIANSQSLTILNGYVDTALILSDDIDAKCCYIPCSPNTLYRIKRRIDNNYMIATCAEIGDTINLRISNTDDDILILTDSDAQYLIINLYTNLGTELQHPKYTADETLNAIEIYKCSGYKIPLIGQSIPVDSDYNGALKVITCNNQLYAVDYTDVLNCKRYAGTKIFNSKNKTFIKTVYDQGNGLTRVTLSNISTFEPYTKYALSLIFNRLNIDPTAISDVEGFCVDVANKGLVVWTYSSNIPLFDFFMATDRILYETQLITQNATINTSADLPVIASECSVIKCYNDYVSPDCKIWYNSVKTIADTGDILLPTDEFPVPVKTATGITSITAGNSVITIDPQLKLNSANIDERVKSHSSTPMLNLTDGVAYGETTQVQTMQGKNLFDRSKAIEDKALTWASGELSSETNSLASGFIPILLNAAYHVNYNAQIMMYDSEKNYIGNYLGTNDGYATFTITNASCAFVRCGFRAAYSYNTDMTTVSDIQLELGSTATAYEPFTPNSPSPSYPSPLVNNILAGTYRYDKDGNRYLVTLPDMMSALSLRDTWDYSNFIHIKYNGVYRIPSNVTWNHASGVSWSVEKRVLFAVTPAKKVGLNTLGYCTHFGIKNGGLATIGSNMLSVYSVSSSIYWYPNIAIFGLTGAETEEVANAALQTWLTNNAVYFTYQLATPIKTTIEPELVWSYKQGALQRVLSDTVDLTKGVLTQYIDPDIVNVDNTVNINDPAVVSQYVLREPIVTPIDVQTLSLASGDSTISQTLDGSVNASPGIIEATFKVTEAAYEDQVQTFAFDDILMNFKSDHAVKYLSVAADLLQSGVISDKDLITFYDRLVTDSDTVPVDIHRLYTGTSNVVSELKNDANAMAVLYSNNIGRFTIPYSNLSGKAKSNAYKRFKHPTKDITYSIIDYSQYKDFSFIPNRAALFVNGKFVARDKYTLYPNRIYLHNFGELIHIVDVLYSKSDADIMRVKHLCDDAYETQCVYQIDSTYNDISDEAVANDVEFEPLVVTDKTYQGYYDVLINEYIINGKLVRLLEYLTVHQDERTELLRDLIDKFHMITDGELCGITKDTRIVIPTNGEISARYDLK